MLACKIQSKCRGGMEETVKAVGWPGVSPGVMDCCCCTFPQDAAITTQNSVLEGSTRGRAAERQVALQQGFLRSASCNRTPTMGVLLGKGKLRYVGGGTHSRACQQWDYSPSGSWSNPHGCCPTHATSGALFKGQSHGVDRFHFSSHFCPHNMVGLLGPVEATGGGSYSGEAPPPLRVCGGLARPTRP